MAMNTERALKETEKATFLWLLWYIRNTRDLYLFWPLLILTFMNQILPFMDNKLISNASGVIWNTLIKCHQYIPIPNLKLPQIKNSNPLKGVKYLLKTENIVIGNAL